MNADPFAPLTRDEMTQRRASSAPGNRWTPIAPVPDGTPEPTTAIYKAFAPAGYHLSKGWRYLDTNGRLLGFAVRFDRPANGKPADKQVLPVSFCEDADGRRAWRLRGFNEPRPLYRLDALAARPEAPVLVVEGEKAAEVGAERFPDYVAMTSPGGSNAAGKADWSVLRGRNVTIWPDADEPGAKYAKAVVEACRASGARDVRVVELPEGLPEGWDLADPVPPHLDERALAAALAGARSSTGWEVPMPIVSKLPPVEPFVPELLPAELRDYVFDVAERQQSAPDFAAVAALCGLSAVVGNKVRIRPKQNDDWEVVPNLWGAIIGRPSAMKSPAMQSALGPLYSLQDTLRKEWEAECKGLAVEDALAGLDAKEASRNAAKAMKGGDRDAARKILLDAKAEDMEPPPCPRLIVNDATVEKLGELLNENPNGLLLIRDELPGFLARLESEEHQSERAFYLEAFNGDGQFVYDRIGRGTVHIKNATVSMIGGVQPSRIAPIVRGAVSGASNDGLIQRLQMAVWPDDIATWTWVDRRPEPDAREAFQRVFSSLQAIPHLGDEGSLVLNFTARAQDLFREWMTEIQTDARSGLLSSIMESHILKMPKTVASLALIFELISGGRTSVGENATLRALGWADYLLSHANRLYAAGQTVAEDGARLIVERRNQLPDPFTARDVQRKAWSGLGDKDAVASAIETLIATHHCREVTVPPGGSGGRPTVSYAWNPSLKAEG